MPYNKGAIYKSTYTFQRYYLLQNLVLLLEPVVAPSNVFVQLSDAFVTLCQVRPELAELSPERRHFVRPHPQLTLFELQLSVLLTQLLLLSATQYTLTL